MTEPGTNPPPYDQSSVGASFFWAFIGVIRRLNPESASAGGHQVADLVRFLEDMGYKVFALPKRRVEGEEWWKSLGTFVEASHCPRGELANVVCLEAAQDPANRGRLASPPVGSSHTVRAFL